MANLSLPYVVVIRAKGRRYTYFRRPGVRVRLPDVTDPGFLPAYHAAAATAQPSDPAPRAATLPGSMAALVAEYRASPTWRDLAPATRVDYAKALGPLAERFGHLPAATMPRAFVFKLRDSYATAEDGTPTPRRANRMVAVLGLLMSWAVNRGWRKDNPAAKPGRLKTGPGYLTWRPEDFAAFMACDLVAEPLRRAAALGWYTGQRKQDCIALPRSARRDGGLEVRQAKTGALVWIPLHRDLAAVLDAAPASDAETILTRPDGQPWRESHFDHAFADAVCSANLYGLTFHGLRKGAASNLAELGASASEVQSITGHKTLAEVTRYTAAADQKRRARSAIKRMES